MSSINDMNGIDKKYVITKLFKQAKAKSEFEEVNELELCLTGIVGESERASTNRQITLISKPALDWMASEGSKSICGTKFKANLHIDTTLKDLKIGDRVQIKGNEIDTGFPVIEITGVGKKCYPDICKAFDSDKICILQDEIRFGRIVKEGKIKSYKLES